MSKNVIKDKSFQFAIRIVELYKLLIEEKKEFILSKQLLRSGTAIGALIEEALQAESKPNFIHKLSIANKEAHETDYWLRLLKHSGFLEENFFHSIYSDITEILKLITSIINSTKINLRKK